MAKHATALVPRLKDPNEDVRQAVAHALERLEPAELAKYAPALIAKLRDINGEVSKAMVPVVVRLEPAVLAKHAAALLELLEHNQVYAREAAAKVMAGLEPVHLSRHAAALVAMLEHNNVGVRTAAARLMAGMEPEELAKRVAALIVKLEDSDVRTAVLALIMRVEPVELSKHADSLVAKLEHSDAVVRKMAILVALREHSDLVVRKMAEKVMANEVQLDDVNRNSVRKALVSSMARMERGELRKHEQFLWHVRHAVLLVMTRLEPAKALDEHAEAIRKMTAKDNGCVLASSLSAELAAHVVLNRIEPFAEHMKPVVAMLGKSRAVRKAAAETLGLLSPEDLAEHAAAVAAKLTHPDEGVRAAVLRVMAHLTPEHLSEHAEPIRKAATEDQDEGVRKAASALLDAFPLTLGPRPSTDIKASSTCVVM